MTRAQIVLPRILAHEGGYVNHPRDPGGATNKGITLRTFRRYLKPGGSIADLKALTTAQAVVIYKRHYWDKVLADMLPPGVDYAVADFAVNSGPYRAAQYLQRVVGASPDGKIGPQTLACVARMDLAEIIDRLCDRRLAYLKRIRNRQTGERLWITFGGGWEKRLDRVRAGALGDLS